MTYREMYDVEERTESYQQFLENTLKKAMKCVRAYVSLGVCYRIGKIPSEKLFTELKKGRKFLEEMEDV